MSIQEGKSEAFNPLDILATAAALKQVDKNPEPSEETMTQSSSHSHDQDSVTDNTTDTKPNKNGNNGVHVRKIRVLKLSSDIEKMLDEHNYGNSRKNYGKTPSAWTETGVKDRKVIVTVVNRTGDHQLVKSIDSVSVGHSGDCNSEKASSDVFIDRDPDIVVGQVNHTGDTGIELEASQDNKLENSVSRRISSGSGDHSISTEEIGDKTSTESSLDSPQCQNNVCGKTLESQNVGDDMSSETTTTKKNEYSCDSSDSQTTVKGKLLENSNCDNSDNQTEEKSIEDTGVINCDHDKDSPGTKAKLGLSLQEKSHIRMISHTMPNSDTELSQPQTIVININHTKQTVQPEFMCSLSKGDSSETTGSLVQSKEHVESGYDEQRTENSSVENCSENIKTEQSATNRLDSAVSETDTDDRPNKPTSHKDDLSGSEIKKDNVNSVTEAEQNCDEVCVEKKHILEMGNDKEYCHQDGTVKVTSLSLLGNLNSPDNCDVSGDVESKLANDSLFKERSDSQSSFEDVAYPDSKIILKAQICQDSHQISSYLKPLVQSGRSDETSSPAAVDHCYAGASENTNEQRLARKTVRLQSTDSLISDLSQDSGFVETSPETPGSTKHFPPKLNESNLDQNKESGSADSSPSSTGNGVEIKNIKNFLGSSSTTSILSQDLSDVNKTRDAIIALMQQSSSDSHMTNLQPLSTTPVKSDKMVVSASSTSPKVGKFRIGTFGSVSNSTMGLESPKKKPGQMFATVGCTKSLLGKINGAGKSVMPHLISSVKNGQQPIKNPFGSTESGPGTWKTHVEHDHDYCLPPEAESSSPHLMAKLLKDTSMKSVLKCSGREKRTESNESTNTSGKRPRRVSISGRPELPHNGSTELSSPSSVSSSPVDFPSVQPHMTARQRAKAEKAAEYVKMGNSDSKLKITGKFQDDYIYFLNTKNRSRRRTNSQDLPPQIPPDRIFVPSPKPGDIVVPHLTDADLEAIRLGKHASIKPASSSGLGGLSTSSAGNLKTSVSSPSPLVTSSSVPEVPKASTSSAPMSDEESKIINTILSMETGDNSSSTSSLVPDLGAETSSLPLPTQDSFNFLPEQMNLTPEQYEILYSAMDKVQGFEDLNCGPSSAASQSQSELSEDMGTTPTEVVEDKLVDPLSTPEANAGVDSSLSGTLTEPVASSPSTEEATGSLIDDQSKVLSNSENESLGPSSEHGQDKTMTVASLLPSDGGATESDQLSPEASQQQSSTAGSANPAKSLLTKSLLAPDIPVSSEVSSMPDLTFTSLDKSSAPDLSFSSLDKSSLDLFGNDLKLFQEATVPDNSSPATIPPIMPPAPPTDYSAPWIVTVSMFWNDLPAIMIDNLPFVRLVDIHKQILPAKDTGILKKRCQLLGIHVGNCSEMQRYFLVQYGKAFNSKSTLIVRKDDAKMLIGYYVNPVPKPARGEESSISKNSEEHRIGSTKMITKIRGSGTKVKEHYTDSRNHNEVSTELAPPLAHLEERELLMQPPPLQETTTTAMLSSSAQAVNSVPQPAAQLGQRVSRRTRHKKINFLEMLKGDANNNTSLVDNGVPQESPQSEENNVYENSAIEKPDVSKECITETEKIIKKKSPNRNLKITSACKAKNKVVIIKEKGKLKKGKDSKPEEQRTSESENENRVEDTEKELEKLPFFIGKRGSKSSDREQMAKKLKIMKNRKPGALKVKWKIFSKSNNGKRGIFSKSTNKNEQHTDILAVVHKDMIPRNGHKHRMQAGNVFLDQYNNQDSCCIKCCTCKKLFSVEIFLTHLHEMGNNGKLLLVNQPQVFALRDSCPSETQKRLWENFQKRRRLYNICTSDDDKVQSISIETLEKGDKEPGKSLTGLPKKVEQKKRPKGPQKVVLRHSSIPAIDAPVSLSNVRISARKRKQKQLYPIENYSFSRKAHQRQNIQIESDGDEPLSPRCNGINTDGGTPSKVLKLVSTVLDNGTNVSDSVLPLGKNSQGSVLTLANGPEVISFTALQEDETMDLNSE